MIEKGRTPNGMSKAGYDQAIANFAHAAENIAKQIERLPGNAFDKVADLMGRGEVYQEFEEQIKLLDSSVPLMAETYGYTEKQVEEDINAYVQEHATEFMLDMFFGGFQQ